MFYDRLVGLSAELIRQQQKQVGEVMKKLDDSLLGREVKALVQSVKSVVEQSSGNLAYISFIQEQFRSSSTQQRDTLMQRTKELKGTLL